MLQLDATQLYDLSEAGRLLYRDPARLAREARLRHVPAARVGEEIGLPAPWVEAAAGRSPSDPEALCTYWLARLAPPSPDARRPVRPRAQLEVDELLAPDEAARRICASPTALLRLDTHGTLPSLRVDGRPLYDAALTDLVAREHEGPAVRRAADARRALLERWSRYEYESSAEPGVEPAAEVPAAEAPAAYEIPADLGLGDIEPLAPTSEPSTLIEAEGFETVDED